MGCSPASIPRTSGNKRDNHPARHPTEPNVLVPVSRRSQESHLRGRAREWLALTSRVVEHTNSMSNGTLSGMSKVEKVTVSLPAELLARIEDRRHRRQTTRSHVVSELLWRGWRQAETEERVQQYRASYQAEPDTREEKAWADQAAADMFGDGDSGWEADYPGTDASS